MRNRINTGCAVSMPVGLAIGGAVSMIITIGVCFLGARMILGGVMDQAMIGYCSLTALLAGAILGAVTAFKKIQRRKLMVCMLSGAVYFCLLLAITALLFSGQYEGIGVSLITVILGSFSAALLLGGEGKVKKHRRRQKRS